MSQWTVAASSISTRQQSPSGACHACGWRWIYDDDSAVLMLASSGRRTPFYCLGGDTSLTIAPCSSCRIRTENRSTKSKSLVLSDE